MNENKNPMEDKTIVIMTVRIQNGLKEKMQEYTKEKGITMTEYLNDLVTRDMYGERIGASIPELRDLSERVSNLEEKINALLTLFRPKI